MECKLRQIIPLGDGPIAGNLIIGEILHIQVDDSILDPSGHPDPRRVGAIARLGDDYWCRTTDLFQQTRPG